MSRTTYDVDLSRTPGIIFMSPLKLLLLGPFLALSGWCLVLFVIAGYRKAIGLPEAWTFEGDPGPLLTLVVGSFILAPVALLLSYAIGANMHLSAYGVTHGELWSRIQTFRRGLGTSRQARRKVWGLINLAVLAVVWFRVYDVIAHIQYEADYSASDASFDKLFSLTALALTPILGLNAWRLTRRQKSADRATSMDDRAPILFLRSFEDDNIVVSAAYLEGGAHGEHQERFEESVAKELRPYGPVIAVGVACCRFHGHRV